MSTPGEDSAEGWPAPRPSDPAPTAPTAPSATRLTPEQRHFRLRAEVWIVLGLSLGQSAVFSFVRLIGMLTAETPLAEHTAQINQSRSAQPYLDLVLQVLAIAFALMPVALALFLLSEPGRRATHRVGFDLARPLRDLGAGIGLAALIGIPGLGFYLLGRSLGFTIDVQAATLGEYWWAVPVLLLRAAMNGIVEEVIVTGYLMERLEDIGWRRPLAIVGVSALLRGLYHSYQGIGPILGNIVMGVVFAEYYRRARRTMPLVVAHTLIDVVAFVGYQLLSADALRALGLA